MLDVVALGKTAAAGRAATVADLRRLADRLEELPMPEAVEALTLLAGPLEALAWWARRAGLMPEE